MFNTISLSLAALMAVAIMVIGCFYLFAPERMTGSFGLKLPASDADTRAWLRPKGIRDIASGLVVLTMMLTADARTVGIALLVLAIIPLGTCPSFWGRAGRSRRRSPFMADVRGDGCGRPVIDPYPLSETCSWRNHHGNPEFGCNYGRRIDGWM